MSFADKRFDVVYLDPMFPDSSFDAKVGKGMQLLHEWTQPPSLSEEFALLDKALSLADSSGKVIVKRPISAPNLAMPNHLKRLQMMPFVSIYVNPIVNTQIKSNKKRL